MDPDLSKQTVHAELGRSTDAVFAWFSEEPMAAASMTSVVSKSSPNGSAVGSLEWRVQRSTDVVTNS
jgi:hypothetical protein